MSEGDKAETVKVSERLSLGESDMELADSVSSGDTEMVSVKDWLNEMVPDSVG